MEVLSMVKRWRVGGGAATPPAKARSASTIASTALRPSTETEDDDGDGDDEGPFFDLEFALPDEDGYSEDVDGGRGESDDSGSESEEEGERRAVKFTGAGSRRSGRGLSLSPSDDLLFKGQLLPLEPASLLFATSEPHSKPASRFRSATKLQIFMLGLKKPKPTVAEPNGAAAAPSSAASPKQPQQRGRRQSKFFVKFKVEEVPIVSLFTRDSSSRSSGSSSGRSAKLHADDGAPLTPASAGQEEKRFSKDALQRYLSKIKPLYVRVSKRYGEKLRFSGQLSSADGVATEPSPAASNVKCPRPPAGVGNLPAGLKVVCKRLGKSRSASSAVAAVPFPPQPLPRRRDDTLLEQQDGIQSAIAHCKRSFNSGRGSESPLVRSMSDPGDERSVAPSVPTLRSNF